MDIPKYSINTDDLPQKKAKELLHTLSSGLFEWTFNDQNWTMQSDYYFLEQICVEKTTSAVIRIKRTKQMSSAHSIDKYRIRLGKTTPVTVDTGNGDASVQIGDIFIFDLSKSFDVHCGDSNAFFINVPHDVLHSVIPWSLADQLHGLNLQRGTALSNMLVSHFFALESNLPKISRQDGSPICQATLSLLAGAIIGHADKSGGISRHHPLAMAVQIKMFIVEQLANPELDAGLIMKRFKLSRSSLYELFRNHAGVSNYIRILRLRRALMFLTDPLQDKRSVSEIAFACGFNNESHFCKVFRKKFGTSPGEARRMRGLARSGASEKQDEMLRTAIFINNCYFDR